MLLEAGDGVDRGGWSRTGKSFYSLLHREYGTCPLDDGSIGGFQLENNVIGFLSFSAL